MRGIEQTKLPISPAAAQGVGSQASSGGKPNPFEQPADPPPPTIPDTCRELTYLRPKTITFQGTGLKPNTIYYPFFGDVYIGEYCTTTSNPTLDSNGKVKDESGQRTLRTNTAGTMTGNFFLPGKTFEGGTYKFLLVDRIRTITEDNVEKISPDTTNQTAFSFYEGHTPLQSLADQLTDGSGSNYQYSYYVPNDAAAVTLSSVVEYETWFFEYSVQTLEQNSRFTITTNSATPPTNPLFYYGSQSNSLSEDYDVVYISTSARDNNGTTVYDHVFQKTNNKTIKVYRREEIVEKKETDTLTQGQLYSLANFRPSGIPDSAVVTVIGYDSGNGTSGWRKQGSAIAPDVLDTGDSLAQSFYIDEDKFPNGLFVTALGLYFKNVDQTAAVIVELREMSPTGVPSSRILPHGRSVLPGSAAVASVDASLQTRVNFSAPIYLRKATEYCFVIKSTSLGYTTWKSRVGERDVQTDEVVDDQAFRGTLFQAASNSTWAPVPSDDVKFDLYKADFNTAVQGTLQFRPYKSLTTNQYYSTREYIPQSYIKTTKNSGEVTLKVPFHGLRNNDYITIEGATGTYNGITADQLNGSKVITAVPDGDFVTFNTGGTATITGYVPGSDAKPLIDLTPPIMYDQETYEAAPGADIISSDFTNTTQPVVPDITLPGFLKVYANIPVHEVDFDFMSTSFPGLTNTTSTVQLPAYDTYAYSNDVTLNKLQYYSYADTKIVPTYTNSTNNNNKTAYSVISLSSNNKDVSPIINTDGISLVTNSFKINNQNNEWSTLVTPTNIVPGNPYVIQTAGDIDWSTVGPIIGASGTIENISRVSGTKWKAQISGLDSTDNIAVGSVISGSTSALGGSIFYGTATSKAVVTDIISKSSIQYEIYGATGATGPCGGKIYNVRSMLRGGVVGESFIAGASGPTSSSSKVYAVSELIPGQGLAEAKYKSTINTLSQPYNQIKVFVTGNCYNSDIDVYLRVSSEQTTHMDQNWIWLPSYDAPLTQITKFTRSVDRNQIDEWLYEYSAPPGKSFTVYDIKIVMRSTNPGYVPKIHSIRTIANNAN